MWWKWVGQEQKMWWKWVGQERKMWQIVDGVKMDQGVNGPVQILEEV